MKNWHICITSSNKWLIRTYLFYFKELYKNYAFLDRSEPKEGYFFLSSSNTYFHSFEYVSNVPITHNTLIDEAELESIIISRVAPFKIGDKVYIGEEEVTIRFIELTFNSYTKREYIMVKYTKESLNDVYYSINYSVMKDKFNLNCEVNKNTANKKSKTSTTKSKTSEQVSSIKELSTDKIQTNEILPIAEQVVLNLFIKRGITDITHLNTYTRIFELGMEYQKKLDTNDKSK